MASSLFNSPISPIFPYGPMGCFFAAEAACMQLSENLLKTDSDSIHPSTLNSS